MWRNGVLSSTTHGLFMHTRIRPGAVKPPLSALVHDMKAAGELGIAIPRTILLRANRVID